MSTPGAPPPPPPPPPPPALPPPGPSGDGDWDGFIDGPPTTSIPTYHTARFDRVESNSPPPPGYGFDVTIDEPPFVEAGIGPDADGDGYTDAPPAPPPQPTAPTEAAESRFARWRPRRLWQPILKAFAPFLLIAIGASLIGSAWGSSSDSSSSSSGDSASDTTEASPQTVDSGSAATDGSQPVATVAPQTIAPEIIAAANGDIGQQALAIAASYATTRNPDAPTPPQLLPVRSDNVGPDLYELRLVVIRTLGSADKPNSKVVCAEWDVNVSTGAVEERREAELEGDIDGLVDVAVRGTELREKCNSASLG